MNVGEWLKGKKTYLGAAGLAITGLAGFWFDVYDLGTAGLILSAALAAAGLGGKLDRHRDLVLKFLESQKSKGK